MVEREIKEALIQGLISMSGVNPVGSHDLMIGIYMKKTKFDLSPGVRLKDVFDSYYDLVSDGILIPPDDAGNGVRLAKDKFSPE